MHELDCFVGGMHLIRPLFCERKRPYPRVFLDKAIHVRLSSTNFKRDGIGKGGGDVGLKSFN